MAREVSSISRVGTSEPFELQVSRNQISYHTPLFKYGYNPLIINVNETIWDVGGLYSYPGSAVTMTVTSASGATDEDVKITLFGLDENYAEQNEEVTLNSSGVATTTNTYLRVFRAFVSGDTAPAGNVNITNGGTTYARVTAGENQTLMAVYTVPAGKTLYVTQGVATHGTETSGAYMTVRFVTRQLGGVFRTATKVDIIGGEILFPFTFPLRIPEKTDVEVRAICSKNQDNAVGATFEGILIDNAENF